MKLKMRPDAGFPQRVEITYANGSVDVFDEIIDFSAQHLGDNRKEYTVDVRLTMATLENKGRNLFDWIMACILSITDSWQISDE